MARGNVAAIIYCLRGPNIIDAANPELTTNNTVFENPQIVFNDCFSSDNSTLPTITSTWCSANSFGFNPNSSNPPPYKACSNMNSSKIEALTLEKMIENKIIFGPNIQWFYKIADE